MTRHEQDNNAPGDGGGGGDDALVCPAGTPVRRWARQQALRAAVPGAPGWYAVGPAGATNVRAAPAVFACEDPDSVDGSYRILATDDRAGGWSLNAGPYRYEFEATMVAQQVLALAYDTQAWPDGGDLDTDEVDDVGEPALLG